MVGFNFVSPRTSGLVCALVSLRCSGAVQESPPPKPTSPTAAIAPLVPANDASQYSSECQLGQGESCRRAGYLYLGGKADLPPDAARAFASFQAGCDLNDRDSCLIVGRALIRGEGTPVDASQALAPFDKACNAGLAMACEELGLILGRGKYLPRDLSRALPLLDKACGMDDEKACEYKKVATEDPEKLPEELPKRGCLTQQQVEKVVTRVRAQADLRLRGGLVRRGREHDAQQRTGRIVPHESAHPIEISAVRRRWSG